MSTLWEVRYRLTAGALFAIWLASLVLPVSSGTSLGDQPGGFFLFLGWAGMLAFQFAWLANPLLLFTLVYAARDRKPGRRTGAISAIALCLFAASATFYHTLPSPDGGIEVVPRHIGFYFWLVAVLGGAMLVWARTRSEEDFET